MTQSRVENLPFRPRARLLLLLGDQLIRNEAIAVFELVKNAYDADSPYARVTMSRLTAKEEGRIVVEDSGTGMDYDTVTKVWLEPGTDYRVKQRQASERTERFGRLPIGEKGVGRFAAHKLGKKITLISRKKDNLEVVVTIDWKDFEKQTYLDNVPVRVEQRQPEIFSGKLTGTRIEITELHSPWTRAMVRELHRSVTSICSPFRGEGEFETELLLLDKREWLEGLLTVEEALEYALFRAGCVIEGNKLTYSYQFTPLPAMDKVKPRQRIVSKDNAIILKAGTKTKTTDASRPKIGTLSLQFLV